MPILSTSHFLVRPYKIANQSESQDLIDFIEEEEEKLLKNLLGIDFYNAWAAGIGAASPEQKWIDLRDGKEYTYSDYTFKWEGMYDLLIPMVYSRWLHETFDKHTSAGIVVPTPANSTVVSPSRRIGKANAEYFKKAGGAWNMENTLYGFLYQNRDTYTEWEPERWCPTGRVNVLGL